MKIPNDFFSGGTAVLSLARIVSEDSQLGRVVWFWNHKSSKDS